MPTPPPKPRTTPTVPSSPDRSPSTTSRGWPGTGSWRDTGGDAVQPLDVPPRLVGCLRRDRARAVPRLRARPTAPAADRGPDAIRGIVPLMHRHEVEPEDAATATALRRGHADGPHRAPDAKAVFFGGQLPRRLRDHPGRPDRPARRSPRRWSSPRRGAPDPDHGDTGLGRRRPAPPAPRRSGAAGARAAFRAAQRARVGGACASRRTSARS